MTATPALSPWPAPSPADAAPRTTDVRTPSARETLRDIASLLLQTAKRSSSRSARAEHAAAKQEQRISDELTGLPAGWFVLHSHDVGERGDVVGDADHVVIGPAGVRTQYDIRDWLCKQPTRLDAEMVSAVYAFGSSTTTGI